MATEARSEGCQAVRSNLVDTLTHLFCICALYVLRQSHYAATPGPELVILLSQAHAIILAYVEIHSPCFCVGQFLTM